MSSDKVPVSRNKAARAVDVQQWCWRAVGILLLLIGLPLGFRMWSHHRQEVALSAARDLLQRALHDSSKSRQTTLIEQALTELRNCPSKNGSAELLLAAIERALIPNSPLPQEIRRAEEIRTIDLCLAADLYFHTNNLGLSNYLVDMALHRTDDREETLRV